MLTLKIFDMENITKKTEIFCLKIIQKVPEQHTGKALNQGTTEKKPHWALHTHTLRKVLM